MNVAYPRPTAALRAGDVWPVVLLVAVAAVA
jgi:hypothetical protein